ncbi:RNA-binding S4 domain-containing protein [Rhodospirillum rubrum]|uniref:RNA-binding S4 n=1 Tax=Rhodospirillum rubrum (strain ATCC 11170 / ATH 1.1.1 / DSM 467 / LMG 4362 / NCIMB 8255 / S1) TaxID=269796 RepID=Q2RYB5_RHORT|nr:RNA-binding S4 domain-containing protein [Rhodospirillum rubrum]ABC20880.1 RNA-binding S4 [Rhodospirillum rubrum ATCC 11170]AEO46548.1 RNA-binding S4 [Rhodospirillum rubrum F11]MBK5952438.1 RNA-binding protein S4 [Rhodospirillum rubrum]QXG80582.1 RNA-binding S4 domain-containing protein [Rhodospirillum rubrum]HAP99474.1 RNA-binding S4 domain-containing protein [Rhodospirillum rubrum]
MSKAGIGAGDGAGGLSPGIDSPLSQRIDKWLWYARFCKTRGLAQTLCAAGHVKREGESLVKAATLVRPGDRLTLVLGPLRRTVVVRAAGARRGPAPEARTLYDEPEPAERLGDPTMEGLSRPSGGGRPTKKDRRALDRWRAEDE